MNPEGESAKELRKSGGEQLSAPEIERLYDFLWDEVGTREARAAARRIYQALQVNAARVAEEAAAKKKEIQRRSTTYGWKGGARNY